MIASEEEIVKAFEKCAGGCDDDGCIYLEKANELTQKRYDNGFYCSCTCIELIALDALELLKEQQAEIERLKPKKGKWIFTGQKNAYGGTVIQCPFCDDKYAAQNPSDEHFCRNCGAKLMD